MSWIWNIVMIIVQIIGIPVFSWLFRPSADQLFWEMLPKFIVLVLLLSFGVSLFTALMVVGIRSVLGKSRREVGRTIYVIRRDGDRDMNRSLEGKGDSKQLIGGSWDMGYLRNWYNKERRS